jgi:hypothetical protein
VPGADPCTGGGGGGGGGGAITSINGFEGAIVIGPGDGSIAVSAPPGGTEILVDYYGPFFTQWHLVNNISVITGFTTLYFDTRSAFSNAPLDEFISAPIIGVGVPGRGTFTVNKIGVYELFLRVVVSGNGAVWDSNLKKASFEITRSGSVEYIYNSLSAPVSGTGPDHVIEVTYECVFGPGDTIVCFYDVGTVVSGTPLILPTSGVTIQTSFTWKYIMTAS